MVLFVLAQSLATVAAAANVSWRDVQQALPLGIQVWMFASPILYPVDSLAPTIAGLLRLNPLYGVLVTIRAAILDTPVSWDDLALSAVITACIALASLCAFRLSEESLADRI
jgi:lipopolysaccharide transport system permease protein